MGAVFVSVKSCPGLTKRWVHAPSYAVDFLSWDLVEMSEQGKPHWWSPFQRGSWHAGLLSCPARALTYSGPSLSKPGRQLFL